jgi:hypothetical protein
MHEHCSILSFQLCRAAFLIHIMVEPDFSARFMTSTERSMFLHRRAIESSDTLEALLCSYILSLSVCCVCCVRWLMLLFELFWCSGEFRLRPARSFARLSVFKQEEAAATGG